MNGALYHSDNIVFLESVQLHKKKSVGLNKSLFSFLFLGKKNYIVTFWGDKLIVSTFSPSVRRPIRLLKGQFPVEERDSETLQCLGIISLFTNTQVEQVLWGAQASA